MSKEEKQMDFFTLSEGIAHVDEVLKEETIKKHPRNPARSRRSLNIKLEKEGGDMAFPLVKLMRDEADKS